MKRRLSAIVLALGLSVSALSMGVYAEETEAAATEQVTEAPTEAGTESQEAAAGEQATESPAEAESDQKELESEAAETEPLSQEDQLKQMMTQYLTEIAGYTDEQLEQMIESDNASTALIAANWKSVKEELGNFVEVTSVKSGISEDMSAMTITCDAKYDKIDDKTKVVVTYEVNQKEQRISINWDIQYTMGKMMQRAALNTVMGIGIVFLTLLFLSWLIGKMHIIPDMIEKRTKKDAPAPAPAAAAPAAAVVPAAEEEEDLTDDLELVAVITAAIAASETTSGDGFVVRSIRKANKKTWQRA